MIEVAKRFKVIAHRNDLTLELSIGNEPLTIAGNRDELDNLFTILLDNAMKYTPPGGVITVELESDEAGCLVEIRDSGIGISEQDLPYVFDRFYRADKVRA